MPQVQIKAPAPGEKGAPIIEKIFEEERERDRFEYRICAKFDDDIAERVEIAVTWYPLKRYGNHVSIAMIMWLENGLNLEVRKWRDSWNGSGLDFKNTIRIYTNQWLLSDIFDKERYEKISSVKDIKELINDILKLFENFVKYYISQEVEEFIEEEEQ